MQNTCKKRLIKHRKKLFKFKKIYTENHKLRKTEMHNNVMR